MLGVALPQNEASPFLFRIGETKLLWQCNNEFWFLFPTIVHLGKIQFLC